MISCSLVIMETLVLSQHQVYLYHINVSKLTMKIFIKLILRNGIITLFSQIIDISLQILQSINWQMESPFYTIFLSNSWDIHVWLFDIQFNIIFKRALDVQQRFKKFQPLNFIWNCVIFKTNRIGTKKHNLLKLRKTAKSAKCFKNWKKVIQSKMLLTVYFTKTVVNFLEH